MPKIYEYFGLVFSFIQTSMNLFMFMSKEEKTKLSLKL